MRLLHVLATAVDLPERSSRTAALNHRGAAVKNRDRARFRSNGPS